MYQDMYEQGGITGGPNLRALRQQLSGGTVAPVSAPPLQAPVDAPPPIQAPGQNAGPFQSDNASVSGYLTDAVRAFAPTIRGIADETGRKTALNNYLTSLIPEIERRGGRISDIRGDGANVNGRRIDFYRDIEGAADPQYLDVTDQQNGAPAGRGAAPSFAGGLSTLLTGDPMAGIQAAIAKYAGPSQNLRALLAQLGGGQ